MIVKAILERKPAPFGSNKEALDLLVGQVALILANVTAPGISTSDLARRLGATGEQMKTIVPWLALVRKSGLMDDYFTQGRPNNGTFGKPSYKWHADPNALD